MGSQLALKSRIASTASLEKIFNAQEMIASSHIAKARDVALNAKPYTDAIFDAVQALVAHTHIDHPIVKKDEDNPRVAVLALTSDRGMAGDGLCDFHAGLVGIAFPSTGNITIAVLVVRHTATTIHIQFRLLACRIEAGQQRFRFADDRGGEEKIVAGEK